MQKCVRATVRYVLINRDPAIDSRSLDKIDVDTKTPPLASLYPHRYLHRNNVTYFILDSCFIRTILEAAAVVILFLPKQTTVRTVATGIVRDATVLQRRPNQQL